MHPKLPVRIIQFILTTLMDEQHPHKHGRVDEYIVPCQTQQMSQTYLFMNSKYPWKILVAMHLGSMERMKYTIEEYTI